ncbi:GD22590 [Drosophila simulans]|uniref:GD22590 n=1 Tax=Drosophila simulans TaxID=7240 RepID=B4Q4K6_DROSI|nr:GD22590 [Drosophila simulans]
MLEQMQICASEVEPGSILAQQVQSLLPFVAGICPNRELAPRTKPSSSASKTGGLTARGSP